MTAIVPDGAAWTKTFRDLSEVASFLAEHRGKRNIYYTVNPTKGDVTKKPSKGDIAHVDSHVDIDPSDSETPEQAKKRGMAALAAFELRPTVIVDSGNGIQALWRLLSPAGIAAAEARNEGARYAAEGRQVDVERRPHPSPSGDDEPSDQDEARERSG